MPTVVLPTLHADQAKAYQLRLPNGERAKRKAIRCGRRYGKSTLAETIACDGASWGQSIGYFTPTYKFQTEIYADILDILAPITSAANKMDGVIRTTTGGRIDFWTLENERAGRSRKYHKVLIDEAAFGKENTIDIWERAIEPTLTDYDGEAWILSNTNGDDPTNFFWRICKLPKYGFIEYYAPSWNNPNLPERRGDESESDYQIRRVAFFADLKAKKHPLVYQQEYEAAFVDFSGLSLFTRDKLLVDDKPVPFPTKCEQVFAVIDTSVKGGKEHDGTAVIFCSYSPYFGIPLVVLDWDIVQIDAALLEHWIPSIFRRGEDLARMCGARGGFTGVNIEDVNSGSILLSQCQNRGWPAYPLPSELTAAGKDGRAVNAGDAVYQGKVKFSELAYDKNDVVFKEVAMNHAWQQITGFRIGDKNAYKRADDILDCFCYSVAITLGNDKGFV